MNLEELDQIIDRGMRTPLNEAEGQKLKTALHAMAERLSWKRSTEKTSAVVDQPAAVPVEERMGAMGPQRLPALIRLP